LDVAAALPATLAWFALRWGKYQNSKISKRTPCASTDTINARFIRDGFWSWTVAVTTEGLFDSKSISDIGSVSGVAGGRSFMMN
jgi:hypothetical protein